MKLKIHCKNITKNKTNKKEKRRREHLEGKYVVKEKNQFKMLWHENFSKKGKGISMMSF